MCRGKGKGDDDDARSEVPVSAFLGRPQPGSGQVTLEVASAVLDGADVVPVLALHPAVVCWMSSRFCWVAQAPWTLDFFIPGVHPLYWPTISTTLLP